MRRGVLRGAMRLGFVTLRLNVRAGAGALKPASYESPTRMFAYTTDGGGLTGTSSRRRGRLVMSALLKRRTRRTWKRAVYCSGLRVLVDGAKRAGLASLPPAGGALRPSSRRHAVQPGLLIEGGGEGECGPRVRHVRAQRGGARMLPRVGTFSSARSSARKNQGANYQSRDCYIYN